VRPWNIGRRQTQTDRRTNRSDRMIFRHSFTDMPADHYVRAGRRLGAVIYRPSHGWPTLSWPNARAAACMFMHWAPQIERPHLPPMVRSVPADDLADKRSWHAPSGGGRSRRSQARRGQASGDRRRPAIPAPLVPCREPSRWVINGFTAVEFTWRWDVDAGGPLGEFLV